MTSSAAILQSQSGSRSLQQSVRSTPNTYSQPSTTLSAHVIPNYRVVQNVSLSPFRSNSLPGCSNDTPDHPSVWCLCHRRTPYLVCTLCVLDVPQNCILTAKDSRLIICRRPKVPTSPRMSQCNEYYQGRHFRTLKLKLLEVDAACAHCRQIHSRVLRVDAETINRYLIVNILSTSCICLGMQTVWVGPTRLCTSK